jgi:general secretion pathway protein D
VVPVRFASAAELQKLIEPLAPAPGLIHIDAARNILIIEGTTEERQTLLDNIALFDADWLSGMSFALFSPKYTDVEALGRELNQILGGAAHPDHPS